MKVTPLRSQLWLRPRPLPAQTGKIVRVARESVVYACDVIGIGPDVQEVAVGDVVYVNVLAATTVGGDLMLPEALVLAKEL